MKSSLKTWLDGKNPYQSSCCKGLVGATPLLLAIDPDEVDPDEESWPFFIDVLDDGTAIAYSSI
jgi:hypothetical protein